MNKLTLGLRYVKAWVKTQLTRKDHRMALNIIRVESYKGSAFKFANTAEQPLPDATGTAFLRDVLNKTLGKLKKLERGKPGVRSLIFKLNGDEIGRLDGLTDKDIKKAQHVYAKEMLDLQALVPDND